LKLFDYNVTESGFAADIGFEKFWNVKSRISGLSRTCRSSQPRYGRSDAWRRSRVAPVLPLPAEYTKENLPLLGEGIGNLLHHIKIPLSFSGMKPVVLHTTVSHRHEG